MDEEAVKEMEEEAMKILFCYNLGFGNVIQQIPLYLSLEKKYGKVIDSCYLIQFEGDNPSNADCTPNPICPGVSLRDIIPTLEQYDYIIKPPYIYSNTGDYYRDHIDEMRELDSEVARNMRIAEYLGIDTEIERKWRSKALNVPEGYVTIHNGAQIGWERKKYDRFEELCWLIQKEGMECISIGSPAEYVFGTTNRTGLEWRETAYLLNNTTLHVSTDTSTYHLASLMEKPCVTIFTQTSIGKNWDKDFHYNAEPIQRTDLECCPGQLQYHWSHRCASCQTPECGDIPPEEIFDIFIKKIDKA